MTEILVVYGTRQGHAAHIAERIASVLRAAGDEVEVRDARSRPALEPRHRAVIVGASVHAKSYEREVRKWVESHVDAIAARPNAFFSVSLAAATHDAEHDTEVREVIERFFHQTGWHPAVVAKFAGALEYSKYNPLMRFMMKRIVRQKEHGRYLDTSHDYDLTDYAQVDAFAHGFAHYLGQTRLRADEVADGPPGIGD
jgi:menaquinone-dependent protoporphyrinogen oxidase